MRPKTLHYSAARRRAWASRSGWRRVLRLGLLLLGLVVVFLTPQLIESPGGGPRPGELPPADVQVTLDRSRPAGASQLAVGVTHVEYSLDPWGDPAAVARGQGLLRQAARYQNQHLMGFGAPNPEPSRGEYDWSGLDRRVQLMRDTGAIPTITLCCAPDWMKGGKPGATDWSNIEVAPLPQHYDDFASLARQVARRYPDVKHYLVWNELKGFWDAEANNWDYAGYTQLYNKVYDALKDVDPAIQVGGPYLVIEGTGTEIGEWWAIRPIGQRNRAALQYWLKHKHGADFLVVDRAVKDAHDPSSYSRAQYLELTALFGDVTRQLRGLTDLPIWWAESYFVRADDDRQFEAAGLASMLYHQLTAGAAVSLRWGPQAQPEGAVGQSLFTDTHEPGGGAPLPAYEVYRIFNQEFGPGTRLYAASSSARDIEVLASRSRLLLINKRPTAVSVAVGDQRVELAGYGVRVFEI